MLTFPPPTAAGLPPPSSPSRKRDRPHDDEQPARPKPRISAPFIDDDDDDDDEDDDPSPPSGLEPSPKKRMLNHPNEPVESASEQTADVEATENNKAQESIDSASQKSIPAWSAQRHLFSESLLTTLAPSSYTLATCTGKTATVKERKTSARVSYESMVASRSKTKEGRATKSYYGIEIHNLIDTINKERSSTVQAESNPRANDLPLHTDQASPPSKKPKKSLLWTEKYRARNFMDLCGDDGTNRMVLRWLKRWDPLVFPGSAKSRPVVAKRPGMGRQPEEEKPHKKILMLTGPPGLGKTTLAHVCAKQAGYEVLEVNASDDRSRDVVKNRIRTSLGTETVKMVSNRSKGSNGDGAAQKPARPVCVVVDEVDGVVTGSGASGEGGFVKALIDLVQLDQKNASYAGSSSDATTGRRMKKKGDDFRLMRPLILICNDVYHPSLRPLRHSGLAEVIHVGRPSIDAVVGRLRSVFDKEAIPCDRDAARKLCEAAWGMSGGLDAKRGAESTVEGDLRGVMVVSEWVAGRFKSSARSGATERLTKQWIEQHVMRDLANGAAGARGLGRGSVRDIVNRLFVLGGGFPSVATNLSSETKKSQLHEQPKVELGFGEQQKKYTMERLKEMADTSGEISYILTEVFAEYPQREFNDDCYLTKPNEAYDWLHFHDACQSRLYASQEWELAPYLSQPVLACHHLFAAPRRARQPDQRRWGADAEKDAEETPTPFTGPRADFEAREAEKTNRAQLQAIQAQLPPTLTRSFRSPEDVAVEFLPYLRRIVSPDVRPVVVGGSQGSTATVRKESERAMVRRAAEVLAEVGIELHKGKIETDAPASRTPQFVYRMDPDLDALSSFETGLSILSSHAPTRYATRQVLDQELQRTLAQREALARQARFRAGGQGDDADIAEIPSVPSKENMPEVDKTAAIVKKDFFGRVIEMKAVAELDSNAEKRAKMEERKVWVTYHEGMSNAVRKPMPLQDFLKAL